MSKQSKMRADARAAGLTHFFTGDPCIRGHVAPRFASDGSCSVCRGQQARTWQTANRERENERMRRHRAANPEASRAACRKWHHANPEIWHKAHTERRQRNIEVERAKWRKWAAQHPLHRRAVANNRRTRKIKAEGTFTADDIARIRTQQRNCCAYCRNNLGTKKVHIDHIQALAAGGTNWPNNLQLLCQSCNAKKWMLDPITFAQRQGMLL